MCVHLAICVPSLAVIINVVLKYNKAESFCPSESFCIISKLRNLFPLFFIIPLILLPFFHWYNLKVSCFTNTCIHKHKDLLRVQESCFNSSARLRAWLQHFNWKYPVQFAKRAGKQVQHTQRKGNWGNKVNEHSAFSMVSIGIDELVSNKVINLFIQSICESFPKDTNSKGKR